MSLLLGPRLLVEIYCLKYITSDAYNRIWIDTLNSCILKPLKTIAVPQYYCLRQIWEPGIEVPHEERSLFYLNSESCCCLLTKCFSPVLLQNPFLLPELPVPGPQAPLHPTTGCCPSVSHGRAVPCSRTTCTAPRTSPWPSFSWVSEALSVLSPMPCSDVWF